MGRQIFTFEDFKKQNPKSNHYIAHAEEMWEDIEEYVEHPDKYKSRYLSILVNAYELYMKGLLEIKLDDNTNSYNLNAATYQDLFKNHKIKRLAHEIDNNGFANILPTKFDKAKEFDDFLIELQRDYTDSRYDSFSDYEEFINKYKIIEIHRQLILEALGVSQDKYKNMSNSERLRQEIKEYEDDDFDYD